MASAESVLYDRETRELTETLGELLAGQKTSLGKLFDPYLHPRGIKELAAVKPVRIAYAVLHLLEQLRDAPAEQRVRALRSARDEVLHGGNPTLRRNTARVLLQLAKELVRARAGRERLELAHDFLAATTGHPRLVAAQLERYHLLRMPERWNQLAFDYHVHDANSKGRKSPTHLMMDAWIKGLRHLCVIYYNHVPPEAADELLRTAEVMGVNVRIGVDISVRHRGQPVQLVWVPVGSESRKDFDKLLADPAVEAFMARGARVSAHYAAQVRERLDRFNREHLPRLNRELGLEAPVLDEARFAEFVGCGQPSVLHLGEFIHAELTPHFERRVAALREARPAGAAAQVAEINELVSEVIAERYLEQPLEGRVAPAADERVPDDGNGLPEALTWDLPGLITELDRLPTRSRLVLVPSRLRPEDVLEVLHLAAGRITHLEIFNLKDWSAGEEHAEQIADIRQVLNGGSVIEAKRQVIEILRRVEGGDLPDREDRAAALRQILGEIPRLLSFYQGDHRLRSNLGSDSAGRSHRSPGMGLVVLPTLGAQVMRRARRDRERVLPLRTTPELQVLHRPRYSDSVPFNALYRFARGFRTLRWLGYRREESWRVGHNTTDYSRSGNIATLGGAPEKQDNGLSLEPPAPQRRELSLRYLNTPLKNVLKVVVGFIPAFLTFYLTKDWWLLAYLGAVIWFSITGLRNVIQSVIGGGGLRRSPLLKWGNFINWSRVADSLFWTGFSVPLLDYLIKTLLLARGLEITTATNPLVLYSVMALANGCYIAGHNLIRGLQLTAVVGNFFRTVLSIPLAFGLNALVTWILVELAKVEPAAAAASIQLWAAVLSKTASDFVAAIIEGSADRGQNLALRRADFGDKVGQIFKVHEQLEMRFPEQDVVALLEKPKKLLRALGGAGDEIVRQSVINALDLMYFWMYQPRARKMLLKVLGESSLSERRILLRSQRVLQRKRQVSELMLDGLVGKRFDAPLAFYLARCSSYLTAIGKLERRLCGDERPG